MYYSTEQHSLSPQRRQRLGLGLARFFSRVLTLPRRKGEQRLAETQQKLSSYVRYCVPLKPHFAVIHKFVARDMAQQLGVRVNSNSSTTKLTYAVSSWKRFAATGVMYPRHLTHASLNGVRSVFFLNIYLRDTIKMPTLSNVC